MYWKGVCSLPIRSRNPPIYVLEYTPYDVLACKVPYTVFSHQYSLLYSYSLRYKKIVFPYLHLTWIYLVGQYLHSTQFAY